MTDRALPKAEIIVTGTHDLSSADNCVVSAVPTLFRTDQDLLRTERTETNKKNI